MTEYPTIAVERAMARRISWWKAAEILGISDRSMRRWRQRHRTRSFRWPLLRWLSRLSCSWPAKSRTARDEDTTPSWRRVMGDK